MPAKSSSTSRVGLFVAIIFVLLAVATLRISKSSWLPGQTYTVYVVIDSATGINKKTPVQIAGIEVGEVQDIELVDNNRAKLKLAIKKEVKLSPKVEARIKTMGFLGDTYIELYQPEVVAGDTIEEDGMILKVQNFGDFSSVTNDVGAIASDIKAITETLKSLMAGPDSSFARSLKNIERITDTINQVSTQNQGNLNAIIANMKALSENLNLVVARNMANIDQTAQNINDITGQVRSGQGTLGKLVYDDTTIEKVNESLDNLNDLLGGANKMEVDLGYHTEFLGQTEEFKHYIELALKPKPDKFFLFELITDPSPDSSLEVRETTITSGGTTNTIREEIETTHADKFRFSAQLAKQVQDFTLRGGIIESSGGVGVDYNKGPVGMKFSAFDFETKRGERPHLKAMGTYNVVGGLYILGGVDDFISNQQDPDWFMGAGIKVTDDDVKSLIGLAGARP